MSATTTIAVALKGIEATVTLTHGHETTHAHLVARDEDGTLIAEAGGRWSGFCAAEIAYKEIGRAIATRRQIEFDDIADALERQGYVCQCD